MEQRLYDLFESRQVKSGKADIKVITVEKGAVLYDIDQPFTDIYEIKSGAVKLGTVSDKAGKHIYEVVRSGDLFGNTAFLPERFSEFSKAIVPSVLYVYKLDFFKQYVVNDPVLAQGFMERIIARWHKTETVLSSIRHLDPRERILNLYNSLSQKIPIAGGRAVSINKNLTKQDLADLTATTRQLVADTLKSC